MEIARVYPSGYCKGVVNAIRLAKDTRNKYPDQKVYILGMIVHNSFVTDELSKLDIITLDDSHCSKEELLDTIEEGVVIFTAHGISSHIKEKAIQKGLLYVDASCEDVLKTKEIIKDRLKEGYEVLYFGKKNHPEAEAVISESDKIHLLSSMKDIEELNVTTEKLFFTNQTTMSFLELKDIIEEIKRRYPKTIIQEEICNATSTRQKAIMDLKDADLLYVVGDSKSNNTLKLFEIGKKAGIKKVFHIESYREISVEDLKDVRKAYVTAGASTPPQIIDEVIRYLQSVVTETF